MTERSLYVKQGELKQKCGTRIYMIVICVLCVNKRVSDRERNITNTVHGYT